MKKIMILGAGVYQTSLIEKAKSLGYFTIVCSRDGKYPGFDIADKAYKVDTTFKEEIYEIAKKEEISAICTSGTDVAVTTIGYVCDRLNLNGISYENSLKATNKMLMKEAFVENNIKTANYYVAKNHNELKDAYFRLNVEKAVVKIVDKSGSRGIKTIDSTTNFEDIFNEIIKQTNEDYVIVEEYIDEIEIGVDLFVIDSKIVIFSPHDKLVYKQNGIGIPAGHILPYYSSDIVINNLYSECKKIVNAYKVINGAINIDAFVKDNGDVYIIEAGARSGATGIPEIISINTGIDYYELIIKAALGENNHLPSKINNIPCASLLIYSNKTGIYDGYMFDGIEGIDINIDYNKGDVINKIEDGTSRVGIAIVKGSTKNEIINKIEEFKKSFNLIVK